MRVNMLASCDYAHGYRQAISDIKDWFSRHSESIRYERLYNRNGIDALLSCMEKEHDYMQRMGPDAEFHVRKDGKKTDVVR